MITLLPVYVIELLVLIFPLMQDLLKHSQKKTKKLKAVVSGHQELAAKEKRISESRRRTYIFRESTS
jgi:hypothetical protein